MLHDGETRLSAASAARLIAAATPAGLPVRRLHGLGTMHRVFRVGDALVARFPRLADAEADFEREAAVLGRVAGRLPVAVPRVLRIEEPGAGFPFRWALAEWLPGTPVLPGGPDDVARAEVLAATIRDLHGVDPTGLPPAGRLPLPQLDDITREAIASTTEVDRSALNEAWDRALRAPRWDGEPCTIHADLLPGNVLEQGGVPSAVLDWGAAGAGDPAHDLVTAWATLRRAGRARLRALLQPDDDLWERARGIALHQALLSIPYYRRSHPRFAAMNVATAAEVLADRG